MIQNQKKRRHLIVGIDDLRNFSLDFARWFFGSCANLVKIPDFYSVWFYWLISLTEVTGYMEPKYLKEGERVLAGFSRSFGFHKVTPRDLMSSFIGSMVCVEGIVTKCCA
ncbi:DNA replication licensing factor MCM3-like [Phoenix dactylifera]|nr:DNA replication licensing factor MCM3-like [Phoenix dactylifera]